ncbi:MAG: TlpA family protein disulfide reductase [Elusimicrobiota bacterium]|jgi:thiol-disulfide isomerase/thioredoxin|nr:TlpA family protein disulfide reductase [Elusimicrobiota bacterium]
MSYKVLVFLSALFLTALTVFAQKAPEFSLQDLDGKTVKLSDFKGKTVFIDFWAIWCPPCRESIPAVAELHKKTSNNPAIVVISINLGDKKSKILDFMKSRRLNYPILLDEKSAVARDYQISAIPSFIIIGKDGNLLKRYTGFFQGISREWEKTLGIAEHF